MTERSFRAQCLRSVYVAILFVLLTALGYLAAVQFRPARVGDGSEYYAMELAWSTTSRPYMTDRAWQEYDQFFAGKGVADLEPTERLRNKFPILRSGNTADFNHFWAYSLLAALIDRGTSSVGIEMGPHRSILLLHASLLALLLIGCALISGRSGALAALVLLLVSPMLWFFTKVHTEWTTVIVATLAVAAAVKRHWAITALLLAVAGTQNVSFVIPAALSALFAIDGIRKHGRVGTAEILVLCMTPLVAVAHPAYYFFRYGVLTPQILAGGATLDGNFFIALAYIFDPDIGLLANWPLGAVLLVCVAYSLIKNSALYSSNEKLQLAVFYFIFIAASLFAQAASQNLNSGATISVARYGLWYLCLFYPALVGAFDKFFSHQRNRNLLSAIPFVFGALFFVAWNSHEYWPNLPETCVQPTRLSLFLATKFPQIYDPPEEVFFERYSGQGDIAVRPRPSITLGPNCLKGLYLGPGAKPLILGGSLCGMSQSAVSEWFSSHFNTDVKSKYFTLSSETIESLRPTSSRDLAYGPQSLQQFLLGGWGAEEAWGVWTIADTAQMHFKVSDTTRKLTINFEYTAFFAGSHNALIVTPVVNGEKRASVEITPDKIPGKFQISIPTAVVAASHGSIDLNIYIDGAKSPYELGLSVDSRKLGIGLTQIELE